MAFYSRSHFSFPTQLSENPIWPECVFYTSFFFGDLIVDTGISEDEK